jgi:hypothetical protein
MNPEAPKCEQELRAVAISTFESDKLAAVCREIRSCDGRNKAYNRQRIVPIDWS